MALTLQELDAYIGSNPNLSSYMGNSSGGFNVQNPREMGQFFNYADRMLRPEFSETQRFTKGGFEDSRRNLIDSYNENLATSKEQARQNVFNYDDNLGRTGSFMFSEPARQRQEMINQTQRSFNQNQRNTASRLSDIARQYEYQYGTPDVSKYKFNIGTGSINNRGNISGGSMNAYKPMGNMQGTLRRAYASQIEQLGGNKYGAANSPLQLAN